MSAFDFIDFAELPAEISAIIHEFKSFQLEVDLESEYRKIQKPYPAQCGKIIKGIFYYQCGGKYKDTLSAEKGILKLKNVCKTQRKERL